MISRSFVLRTCRAPDAILGHIFRFRCDLWIFTYVAWSMIDDFMSPDFWPVVHPMPILGHIFRFRWDLWIFTYVAWSMIDDFMSPDFWPVIRSMPILGHITVLDEIYGSWWGCALIPICETCAETMIYSLSLWWFLSGASRELPNQTYTSRHLDAIMLSF